MVSIEQKKQYRKLRARHPHFPASVVWSMVTDIRAPRYQLEWYEEDGRKQADLFLFDFLFHFTLELDPYHDWTEGRGTFSNSWQPGAIGNPAWKDDKHHMLKWFHPEQPEDITYQIYRDMGYGKREAREEARRQALHDLRLACGESEYDAFTLKLSVFSHEEHLKKYDGFFEDVELSSEDGMYLNDLACHLLEDVQYCMEYDRIFSF